ncbi:MAG: hypothetical protein K2K68_00390 [Duncaniella sp.]|nr:hypothetical protein [Duncaniella sp.]
MLHQSIINKILAKYGKEKVYSADCAALAESIGIGETTVKRMLGLVGENSPEKWRTPHVSTMDILAKWLGYDSYKELLKEIGENNYSSEFTSMQSIEVSDLTVGSQIQLKFEPSRLIVMTYCGDNVFIINESKNCKLLKGDKITLTHLVMGQELIVKEVKRGNSIIGPYCGAKEGGLTALEIIA